MNHTQKNWQDLESKNDLLQAITSEAKKIDEFMHMELERSAGNTDPLLQEVLQYTLFSGGKRVRPMLAAICSRLSGRRDNSIYQLGCAFEFLHVATLVHDDVIDNSDLRRGQKAVHREYGLIPAILVGDYLHAAAMSIVGQHAGSDGLAVFCKATTGMVDGEFMQLRNTRNHSLSEIQYYKAIMGKTGLLISAACEIGALYGGGSREQIESLRQYGEHLGCAFQIIDDLLDYLGDPEKTGKKNGVDLLEGKVTLPLILTMETCETHHKERIISILEDEQLRKSCFREIYEMMDAEGGFDRARQQAEEEVKKGSACLEMFATSPVNPDVQILNGLLRYVLEREK